MKLVNSVWEFHSNNFFNVLLVFGFLQISIKYLKTTIWTLLTYMLCV